MKICNRCKTPKDKSEFWNNKAQIDGLQRWCKDCISETRHLYPPKNRKRKYDPIAKRKQNMTSAAVLGRKDHYRRNKYKKQAYNAVSIAVKNGDLKPIRDCSCVSCGEQAAHYHHHKGYSKNNYLNVIPVCRKCHTRDHKLQDQEKKWHRTMMTQML